eukprot:gene4521-biopygen17455
MSPVSTQGREDPDGAHCYVPSQCVPKSLRSVDLTVGSAGRAHLIVNRVRECGVSPSPECAVDIPGHFSSYPPVATKIRDVALCPLPWRNAAGVAFEIHRRHIPRRLGSFCAMFYDD